MADKRGKRFTLRLKKEAQQDLLKLAMDGHAFSEGMEALMDWLADEIRKSASEG